MTDPEDLAEQVREFFALLRAAEVEISSPHADAAGALVVDSVGLVENDDD
jgi:dihydroorotate dehydrogenase